MSIRIEKKEFFDILQRSFPVIPSKSTLQILSNFLFEYSSGTFICTATDLDHSIQVKTEAEGDDDFSIVVQARKVYEIVRELPDGIITISVDENVFMMRSEHGFTCKIAGAQSGEYPAFPTISATQRFDIGFAILKAMVTKSSFAVSRDESRKVLCGVLWKIEPDRTGMVATDGHRLGSSFVTASSSVSQPLSVIIAPKSLLHIVRTLEGVQSVAKDGETIQVDVDDKYVVFSTQLLTLCTKRIEGPYPDYQNVIPSENPKQVEIERALFINALKRVSVLSNQKTKLVKFVFDSNSLEIAVLNQDIGGEAREEIPIHYEGERHAVGFNAQYYLEILSIIDAPSVRLEMNTQISACLIFPVNNEDDKQSVDDLFLIMPLRIIDEY